MRRHTTKDIRLYDYDIDSWTPSRDAEELETKIICAKQILNADLDYVKAIQEGEKMLGGKHSFSTKSIVSLISEVLNALNAKQECSQKDSSIEMKP